MSDSANASSDTERGDCLVAVDSGAHKGEWLRMVACPIPHCDALQGEDYERFSSHLAAEHGPEDVGLSSGGRPVATDGGHTQDTDTDRAQVDPRVAGLLVVALGLVLVGVITVGAIVP
ncbi:hypothetical protein [Natrinema sp. DC36]|uniref:hypothetical protein n=1 Tax=Natrinema sp. DC36 TaxID=2878680 RepID=UPI001CF06182|nr:hypothetical protein [Natrinema sp. DC36]